MKKIAFFILVLFMVSCAETYSVVRPMSNMPFKWKPYFQEMAIITYKEYRQFYSKEDAVRLTNEKMASIMLKIPQKQLEKFEERNFNHKK